MKSDSDPTCDHKTGEGDEQAKGHIDHGRTSAAAIGHSSAMLAMRLW
jgi:hypothetical protein